MTTFTTRTAGLSDLPPDPNKHVNFSFGMVLGVDDLRQEFAYLAGRDQWLARDLLGYGTAVGLGVTTDYEGEAQGTVEVVVTPGTALSPRGQLIRVGATQCADVNGWLARADNRAKADSLLGNANSGNLTLYVVLSYRACATDAVPIPGEPCRSEEESMAASRLADNYRLELTYQAPNQREEQALRDFVRWLEQVRITHEPGGDGFISLKNFETAVRAAMQGGSPAPAMRVDTEHACEYLRAAFRIWATELRPAWLGPGASAGVPPTEEGVMLAELSVPVVRETGGGWVVAARASRQIEIREERRPYLLHLRMVQEWIECGRRVRAPSDSVVTEVSFGQTPAPGVSESYSRADHTHGTPPLTGDVVAQGGLTFLERIQHVPIEYDREGAADGQVLTYFVLERGESQREFVEAGGEKRDYDLRDTPARWRPADLRLQGSRVAKAQDAGYPEDGNVLTYFAGEGGGDGEWRAMKSAGATQSTLSGDVTGDISQTVVQRLQGVPVARFSDAPSAPKPGQVLTFLGADRSQDGVARWVAADPPSGGGSPPPPPPVTLAGDVTGAAATTRVERIYGAGIMPRTVATPFNNGDVLTFSAGKWVPQAPAATPPPPPPPPPVPDLLGDVVGKVEDNQVHGIRGFEVITRGGLPNAPAYHNGDVLTWRDKQWVPEPKSEGGAAGPFVERPAGLPPYAIVAAGIVSADASMGPVYNDLNLRVTGNGVVTVGFTGYKLPDDTFQYIVKAMPVFNAELRTTGVVVMFDSFLSTDNLGFRLRVMNNGVPMDGEMLKFLQLMIEVSRYEMVPREGAKEDR